MRAEGTAGRWIASFSNRLHLGLIIIFTRFSSSRNMPNSSSYQSDTISANTEQNGISFHYCYSSLSFCYHLLPYYSWMSSYSYNNWAHWICTNVTRMRVSHTFQTNFIFQRSARHLSRHFAHSLPRWILLRSSFIGTRYFVVKWTIKSKRQLKNHFRYWSALSTI